MSDLIAQSATIRDAVRERRALGGGGVRAVARAHRGANPALHAFNTVTREQALARAAAIDRARRTGGARPLAGVPVAAQGQHLHARRPHDRVVADPRARSCRRTTPPSSSGSRRPARSSSARPTATSSRWARRTRTPRSARRGILGHRSDPGRIERRIGGGGRRRHGAARARLGHRRIDPPAGRASAASSA